ncbi:hypothetical protein IWW50_000699 [Coemansia erecta]|nr:hypothetical protein IWW50_000699 [Coemansia erecta]
MASHELKFEAMMASITAPPLSLHEFRQFVAHDAVARNALAFREWYQRYKTVYFDRASHESTVLRTTSSRLGIPSDFMPTVRKRAVHAAENRSMRSASFSAPDIAGQDGAMLGNVFTLKAHSFSVLHENMVNGAFHTASTGSSGDSGCVSGETMQRRIVSETQTNGDARSLGRRRTLPPSTCQTTNNECAQQEETRASVQSLLIFECWARFLCASAQERVAIPETELLYVQERLPLNITHLRQPLLCRGDMLASQVSVAEKEPVAVCGPPEKGTARRVVSHRELQPHEQLNKNIVSQISKQALRRIETMPMLKHSSRAGTGEEHHVIDLPPVRLVDVGRLQNLHYALRPRPPFAAPTVAAAAGSQLYGYRPVPKHVTRLIIPSNIPPALFETTAKLSADYLLQHHFARFYQHAHYNMTRREQRATAIFALVQLVLGVAVAVSLAVAAVPRAWRVFALPLLWSSAACLAMAWSRVYVWRWWQRIRPTALIAGPSGPDGPTHTGPDPDLHTVRWLTGTLDPQLQLAGTLKWGSHFAPASVRSHAVHDELFGTTSTLTLWSHVSRSGVLAGAPSWLVRFMLRTHRVGDQWRIDMDAPYVRVLEPSVLGGQCSTLAHHAAIMIVVCCTVAIVLLLY